MSDRVPPFWVMTFNMAGQARMDWHVRREVTARMLHDAPAQIIGLQEFGRDPETGKTNWEELVVRWEVMNSEKAGFRVARGLPLGDIEVNPVLFDGERFFSNGTRTYWLSEDGTQTNGWDGDTRAVTVLSLLDRSNRKRLLHVNFHLSNTGEIARYESIKGIIESMEDWQAEFAEPGCPVVLTGDANVCPDSTDPFWTKQRKAPYWLMYKAGFQDAWNVGNPRSRRRPCTYHEFRGQDYVCDKVGMWDPDWIFVRGFKVLNCTVVRDTAGGIFPSDHYPMMALLDYE